MTQSKLIEEEKILEARAEAEEDLQVTLET